ncbi:MAG: DUF350 domain-containing protein [Dactylosporangium sp.]|nr:DUF350 domain-containing protein [Dactylosporangium sp.]NNJ61351.1 DUF350 domain-containing protein [Dactylosporangium sp.]
MRIGDHDLELPGFGDYGLAALKLLIFAAFIVLAWALINRITSFDDHHALFEERNTAYALQRAGLVFGQALALTSLINYRSSNDLSDFAWLIGGGIWITGLLLGLRIVAPMIINAGSTELERTVSVGLVRGSFYAASGLVIGAGLSGWAPSLATGLASTFVFTVLGIAVLIGVYVGNGHLPPYRLSARIREGNVAAAFIASGFMIALGLVLRYAIAGDFEGWGQGLVEFTLTAVLALGLFYLLCLAVDRWIISNATLIEVVRGGHEVAAAVVAVALVAIAIGISAVAI